MAAGMLGEGMNDAGSETVLVEVELPGELVDEIDGYAMRNGYPTRSAVVADALRG
jgi:metal-responsive CopG/Arc/MetJ family transcriptional regulator